MLVGHENHSHFDQLVKFGRILCVLVHMYVFDSKTLEITVGLFAALFQRKTAAFWCMLLQAKVSRLLQCLWPWLASRAMESNIPIPLSQFCLAVGEA